MRRRTREGPSDDEELLTQRTTEALIEALSQRATEKNLQDFTSSPSTGKDSPLDGKGQGWG
jgi:hypothetical protein